MEIQPRQEAIRFWNELKQKYAKIPTERREQQRQEL